MSDYTGLIATLSVTILALIAVLNYLSRPLLIRSVERHTNDIRSLLDNWLKRIGQITILAPHQTPDLGEPLPSFHLSIESDSLFKDLTKHDRFKVLNLWEEYKKELINYRKAHHNCLKIVYQELKVHTRLELDPNFKDGFNLPVIQAIYENFFAERSEGSPIWQDIIRRLEIAEEGTLLRGHVYGFAKAKPHEIEKIKTVLNDLIFNTQKTLGDKKYQYWIQSKIELQTKRRDLQIKLQHLLHKINDFKSIPLMTEKCNYIRRRDYILLALT